MRVDSGLVVPIVQLQSISVRYASRRLLGRVKISRFILEVRVRIRRVLPHFVRYFPHVKLFKLRAVLEALFYVLFLAR